MGKKTRKEFEGKTLGWETRYREVKRGREQGKTYPYPNKDRRKNRRKGNRQEYKRKRMKKKWRNREAES